jgi:hypothetical protein
MPILEKVATAAPENAHRPPMPVGQHGPAKRQKWVPSLPGAAACQPPERRNEAFIPVAKAHSFAVTGPSRAPSVAALRASLLAPATYSPDFRRFDSFYGPEVASQLVFTMPLSPGR